MRIGGPRIDASMLVPLLLMAAGFSLVFVALLLLRMRTVLNERKAMALRLNARPARGPNRTQPGRRRPSRRCAEGERWAVCRPLLRWAATGSSSGRPMPWRSPSSAASPSNLGGVTGRALSVGAAAGEPEAAMTRKQQRLGLLALGMAALAGATALVLAAFNDNLVFFYSPSELKAKAVAADRRMRIGGLVEAQSLSRAPLTGAASRSASPMARTMSPSSIRACFPTCFARGRAPSPRASCARTACSRHRACSPSMTRTTCRAKSWMP